MRKLFLGVLMVGWMAGCTFQTTTTQPTPAPTLTGTWSGDLPIQGVATRMTWTLTQTDSSVSGPVLVLLPTGTVLLNGALSGTLSGSTLTYVINIGPGAIPSQPACTGQLGGTATTTLSTTSTIAGSYAVVTSTCATPFSSGAFTLTRT
jgi:hypothetical protein